MCLAVPCRITEIFEHSRLRTGKADFGGVSRDVCLECVSDCRVGDYVLVHVGFAIAVVDEEEALSTLRLLETSGELAREKEQLRQ
jgi:hydrogenase expression/formation protein HypC